MSTARVLKLCLGKWLGLCPYRLCKVYKLILFIVPNSDAQNSSGIKKKVRWYAHILVTFIYYSVQCANSI